MSKYKININDLMKQGGAKRLERDGFSKETIMKAMYKESDGMTKDQRSALVSKLYDRREDC